MMVDREDAAVPYMARTRRYYRALGYERDYVWAQHSETPFAPLEKPLAQCTVGLITTAGPPDLSNRDESGRRHVWSGETANPPPTFDTDVAWDKEATHTDDRESFLPIDAMQRLVDAGEVGALAARFHGAPTEYSHRKTLEHDAPELLSRLRDDGADIAILCAL